MKKQDIAILYSSYNGVLEMPKIFKVITPKTQEEMMRDYIKEEQPNKADILKLKADIDTISRAIHAQQEGIHKSGFIQLRDSYLPLLLENFNRVLANS